jgi:hypothetical protein
MVVPPIKVKATLLWKDGRDGTLCDVNFFTNAQMILIHHVSIQPDSVSVVVIGDNHYQVKKIRGSRSI